MVATRLPDPECWPVPGTATFAMMFPSVNERYRDGELTDEEAMALAHRRLWSIAGGALRDCHARGRLPVEDLVQELMLRIARIDVRARFDPQRGDPASYLYGIARTVAREQLWRRRHPQSIAIDAMDRVGPGGSQLERAVRLELYDELYGWLDQLSNGELRAVIREFGPIEHYSPPKTRRRPRNPDALDRAVELLRNLGAHRFEQ